ncbi:MAG: Gfo/Idh/MocA family oxidoreductase [Gemmatimonadaceae bacterium]
MSDTAVLWSRNVRVAHVGCGRISRNRATIEVTMLTFPKNLEGSITIQRDAGTVKIGGTAVNKVEHWSFADYDEDDKLVEQARPNPPMNYGFGHEAYYRHVLAVLRGAAGPDTDGRAGRKSPELILGMYESARTGRDVPLPLRTSS